MNDLHFPAAGVGGVSSVIHLSESRVPFFTARFQDVLSDRLSTYSQLPTVLEEAVRRIETVQPFSPDQVFSAGSQIRTAAFEQADSLSHADVGTPQELTAAARMERLTDALLTLVKEYGSAPALHTLRELVVSYYPDELIHSHISAGIFAISQSDTLSLRGLKPAPSDSQGLSDTLLQDIHLLNQELDRLSTPA